MKHNESVLEKPIFYGLVEERGIVPGKKKPTPLDELIFRVAQADEGRAPGPFIIP